MIASIAFHRFRALRDTSVLLAPFNLVVGPNGSGKTSLMEAILRLRTLAALPVSEVPFARAMAGPEIEFGFDAPFEKMRVKLGCESDAVCDTLRLEPARAEGWDNLRLRLATLRGYVLDDQGHLRANVVVFIDGRRCQDRHGLADALAPGAKVHVLQALSGG